VKPQDFEIKRASIFDMNKIVKMAFFHHKNDPKFREIRSNPLKSFLYRLFGPLYVRLTLISFKAVACGKIAGYVLIKKRDHSIHIWDLVVDSEFRGKGIGRSLMRYAEKIAEDRHRYVTLAVMEDNIPAIRLYSELGYENLQFSPVCYLVTKPKAPEKGSKFVELESISEEEAIQIRSDHYAAVLDAVVGPAKRETALLLYPLPSKIRRKTECFRILASAEVGYLSVRRRKDLTSIFLLINPKVWETDAESDAIKKVIEKEHLKSDQFEICVVQAYEENLQKAFRKADCVVEREIPRLVLVKKLD
jgi:GNAT superfamily N-acetyltransferase